MSWLGGLFTSNPGAHSLIGSAGQVQQSQGLNSGIAIQQTQMSQNLLPQGQSQYNLGTSGGSSYWQYQTPTTGTYMVQMGGYPIIFNKENIEELFKNEDFRKELKKFIFKEELNKVLDEKL